MQARQHGGGGLSATTDRHTKEMSAKTASPPPVGGPGFSDEQVAALLAAGRLIQNKKWPWGRKKIEKIPGEAYPMAVFRKVYFEIDGDERRHLRELVAWVRDYEREEDRRQAE